MNRVILITGAGRRLGRELALDWAARGWRVAVHCHRSLAAARATVRLIEQRGGQAKVFRADLRRGAQVKRMVAQVAGTWGRLDSVIASAGVMKKTPWPTLDEEKWDLHLDTNLKAGFLLARAAADCMKQGGAMLFIADWSGFRPHRHFLPYCVSKAGVIALTRALALELAPRIRVNCLAPGLILPPEKYPNALARKIRRATPLGRGGRPEDLLAAARFLIEGTDYATGTTLVLDGGRLVADPGVG